MAVFAARDTAHNHAVLRAIGFTPNQTINSLITTQQATAAPATAAGIPIGLLLFRVVYDATDNSRSNGGPDNPPAAWLAIVVVVVVIALAALLAAAPARTLARRPIAPALTTD